MTWLLKTLTTVVVIINLKPKTITLKHYPRKNINIDEWPEIHSNLNFSCLNPNIRPLRLKTTLSQHPSHEPVYLSKDYDIMNKTRTYSPSILIKHQEEQIYSKQYKTTSRFKHSKETSRTQILDIIVFILCNLGPKEA
jgi:hypothetical protein